MEFRQCVSWKMLGHFIKKLIEWEIGMTSQVHPLTKELHASIEEVYKPV